MKKLAIVILNWNGAEMMRQYLPSVLRCSTGDVIVADNASTDGSLEMLQKEFPKVPVVVLEKNFGFAEGYNEPWHSCPTTNTIYCSIPMWKSGIKNGMHR